jgi:4,5-dihydroxyphthalate decarboxylase
VNEVPLAMAVGDYDHVRDVSSGRIPVEGVKLTTIHLPVEQIFQRFHVHRDWEISEFSFAKYVSMVAAGDDSLVAVPVFPSRVFRHSSIYVRANGDVRTPADLIGGRIGIPEWAQTAAVYTRGLLQEDYGVELTGVRWIQAGVNRPGRRDRAHVSLPDGVTVESMPDRSLNEMLVAGDLDALLSARPPTDFTNGSGALRRLFPDYVPVERAYYERTRIFPIMHVLVIRADVNARHPWVARNLVDAFEAAKRSSLARVSDVTASCLPLPWMPAREEDAVDLFGEDPWPYGIDANRPTLEAFLRMGYEQGVCVRHLQPEELFSASALASVIV